ncbi:MAG: RAQPRD family integrative conjugative element protein [Azoarcus sp.]|nr:RAQPRD family integrative conjugative element protein [Azoarcus sp.]
MKIIPRITLPLAASFAFLLCAPPAFADDAIQRRELAAVLRQLDLAERLARGSEAQPVPPEARYHFDYPRLYADLARIRAGIHDYLNPPRAQPRDLSRLSGEYRREADGRSHETDRESAP